MPLTTFPALQGAEGMPITPSDTLDIFNDPGNKTGVESVFIHNRSAGGEIRVMPAGQRVPPIITLTGTSGTANIAIKGVNYLATFNTTLAQTAADFVTTHRAKLLEVGVTVTNITGAELRFVGAGVLVAPVNASGDLAGTLASAPTPITIYVEQGAVFPEPVRRVYATSPVPPLNLTGLFK